MINNTVEQRILDMQRSKQALADGAFGEGEGGKLGRVSHLDKTTDGLVLTFQLTVDDRK